MLPCLLVLPALLGAPGPKAELPPALKAIQGEWRCVSVEEKGRAWSAKEAGGVALEIAGDVLAYKRDEEVERFRVTLDAARSPAWIDLRLIAGGAESAWPCHGIYARDGDRLKVCVGHEFKADDPDDRPREFATGDKWPPRGRLLYVLERVKK